MELFNTKTDRFFMMIIIIILTFLIAWLVKKFIRFLYKTTSKKRPVIDAGNFLLISSLVRFGILIIGISYAISFEPYIKSISTSLLASAGIATAIVGFAAKDVLANFVSGFTIVLFRPFTITDWIKVGADHEGIVEEIKLLHTVIKDITNRRMIIPNSKIVSSYLINSSYRDKSVCQHVEFNISYTSDISKAKEIIRKVAEAHPFCIDNRTDEQKKANLPIVTVMLIQLGEYAIKLRALVWVKNPQNSIAIRWTLNEKVKEHFDIEGIEIPFPYQNLM